MDILNVCDIKGLQISLNAANPMYQINIAIGQCRDSEDDMDFEVTSPITGIDLSQSGAGGLDTGSESVSTWYAVHVIFDNNGVKAPAGIFSLSHTSPTMPDGYDKFKFLGWIRNDDSGNIFPFRMEGKYNFRKVIYQGRIAVLVSGTAESFIDIDCRSALPPTVRIGEALIKSVKSGNNCEIKWREDGLTSETRLVEGYDKIRICQKVSVNSSQQIEYCVNSGAEGTIKFLGYSEDL